MITISWPVLVVGIVGGVLLAEFLGTWLDRYEEARGRRRQ